MNRDPVRTLVFRLTAVTVAVLLALSLLASWSALHSFERVLFPELRAKAAAVAEVLTRQINRALDYGVPLDQLPGLAEALAQEAAGHPDIARMTVEDLSGRTLAAWRQPQAQLAGGEEDIIAPLTRGGIVTAQLRLTLDPGWLARASVDLMLEVASELLVAVLITFEVLLLVVHLSLGRVNALRHTVSLAEAGDFRGAAPAPAGELASTAAACRAMLDYVNHRFAGLSAAAAGRFRFRHPDAPPLPPPVNLTFLRLPVFLFCLSEELSRPFMPAYAQGLAPSAPWLPVDLAVSLPITLFMLVWALSQPLGARLSVRIGRGGLFAAAAALAAIGLAMTAETQHLLGLLLWRCVTALGYGLALITAQGLVVDHTTRENRAGGLALFIGALLAAGVCGPVAGGIIADQAGASATLQVGAGLALAAAATLFLLFHRTALSVPPPPAVAPGASPSSAAVPSVAIGRLARDLRFGALMLLSAVPTKIAATGVLFCLLPLLLAEAGADKAEIGRTQMMYFLAFIIVSPLAAGLSDRWAARRGFVVAGGLATLLAMAPIGLLGGDMAAALAIGLFGAAQALIGAPQLTLVTQIAARLQVTEIAAIGWYRLLERLGGALGPLLAIALAAAWSYRAAMLGIGLLCGGSALLFWLLYRGSPSPVVGDEAEAVNVSETQA